MTNAQLPASVFPLTPPQTGATPSRLGSYLTAYLVEGSTLAYALVRPIMEGALALSVAFPFDTSETLQVASRGRDPYSCSLLEGVLRLTNSFRNTDVKREWPTQPEAFSAHPQPPLSSGEPSGVDTEWVAAALVAAGCNPWTDSNPMAAFALAIRHEMAGLVERFLACPQAPSAQALADSRNGEETYWETMSRHRSKNLALKVFLENGARISNEKLAVKVLSKANSKAVLLLTQHDLMPLSEEAHKAIGAAWRERTKASGPDQLGSEEAEAMQVGLWGQATEDLSSAALDVYNSLSVKWREPPRGSSSQAYDFMRNTGIKRLTGRARMKTGPMAGSWSLLAAATVSRIRQGNAEGALGWSVPTMLSQAFNQKRGSWESADCSQPPYQGSLADAIGFDWRPGIAIDGPVALALFAQIKRSKGVPNPVDKADFENRLQTFSQATAIGDPLAWAVRHSPDAVAFTCQVLKGKLSKAADSMLGAWGTAFLMHPAMVDTLNADTRLDLISSLVVGFKLSNAWLDGTQQDVFDEVFFHLFPHLTKESFFTDHALAGTQKQAALVYQLARNPQAKDVEQQVAYFESQLSVLTDGEKNLIDEWAEARAAIDPNPENKALLARWNLNRKLNDQPVARTPAPRF